MQFFRVSSGRTLAATASFIVAIAGSAGAQRSESYPERCGAGVFPAQQGGYVPLPRGDVFCALIADPKATRSFASYQKGNESDLASDIAAVGIADQFPFFRAFAGRPGNGVQLGVQGAVFAQFDLGAPSYDLLNADYMIGLPLTFRAGPFSGRARVYHQSSHLGDELVLRPNSPARENLSFESAELLLSLDISALRVYGGAEDFFYRDPEELADRLCTAGSNCVRARASTSDRCAVGRIVAAADVKVVNDSVSRTGVSVRAGFEFGRPRDQETPSRRWSLLAEYYEGPSPYGQFYRQKVRLTGLGFQFTLLSAALRVILSERQRRGIWICGRGLALALATVEIPASLRSSG